jgi:two-component system, cell cycle response regulator DivK
MIEPILKDKRIFYIEDDPKNRAIVQTILEAAGARMEFEKWGFQEVALPKLRAYRADLILLDLMFPMGISGYDIFDAIRHNMILSHLPVVAVSAADASVEIPKARSKGFAGFIGKPIDIRLFPHQIASVLNGETVWYAA